MAIILDNKVNSAPVLQSRIGGGRARITLGGFKDPMKLQQEAKDLVAVLRAGALPAPLRKTFETQVGPTPGQRRGPEGQAGLRHRHASWSCSSCSTTTG